MSGALIATCGVGAPASAGSVAPGPLAWMDLYGVDTASSQTLTVTGLTAPVTLGASHTGSGLLGYVLNGNPALYTGAFIVHPGDQLSWFLTIPPVGPTSAAGMVTITNVSAGTTLDRFNYVLNSSRSPIP